MVLSLPVLLHCLLPKQGSHSSPHGPLSWPPFQPLCLVILPHLLPPPPHPPSRKLTKCSLLSTNLIMSSHHSTFLHTLSVINKTQSVPLAWLWELFIIGFPLICPADLSRIIFRGSPSRTVCSGNTRLFIALRMCYYILRCLQILHIPLPSAYI